MIKLFNGDCLIEMEKIESSTVDFIFSDIPYGTTMCKWDSVIDLDLMWKQLKRIIKPNGAIALMAQTPFDKILGCSNLDMLRYEYIWEKPAATGFFNAKKMPLKAHENILVFYNKLPTYNPIMTHGHKRKTASRTGAKSECYGKDFVKTNYNSTSRYPRSVQKISTERGLHPTQKPVALGEFMIETFTNEKDTVLDFTMGSGSFGVAAKNLNRKFIGIEKELSTFELASGRINHD